MEKHFTATVYIVSRIDGGTKVLLHKHKKLNMWLGIGGHIEKDEDPIEAALREVKEETDLEIEIVNLNGELIRSRGLKQLVTPFAMMEETIPSTKDKKAHKHIDLIYIATTQNPELVKMPEEFGWFSKEELIQMELAEDVRFLAKKILTLEI